MLSLGRGPLPERAGRKAQMLARMYGAGLPVLDGLVLLSDEALDVGVLRRIAELGPGPYVVRSSSTLEDGALASAAGLYESLTGVAADQLDAAVRRVRASATADEVVAYLGEHGEIPRPIAVLVQPMAGRALLGVASSDTQRLLVEERDAGVPEWGDSTAIRLSADSVHPVARMLRRVEALLPGPLQMEYARTGEDVVLLQVRPSTTKITHVQSPVGDARRIAWPPGRWRLDAEHNPDPISQAQADLVALLDGPRFGPRSRVIGCYLYVREDQPRSERRGGDPVAALQRFNEELEPSLLGALHATTHASLTEALATYQAVLARYTAEIRPALGVGRRDFETFVQARLGDEHIDLGALLGGTGGTTSERDRALFALGRDPSTAHLETYLARYGAYARAWDVAIACDDEDPARVLATAARRARGADPEHALARARARADAAADALRSRLAPSDRPELDRRWAELRALHSLAESDDRLFFEAQRLVRRALRQRGAALLAQRRLRAIDDVFDVPLARAIDGAGDLQALADTANAARRGARATLPPLRIVDRVPEERSPPHGAILRGRPAGGQARGRAVVVRSLDRELRELPDDVVLVLPAALPSLAPYLSQLRGLVTEHGGALSHAATLAREAGVAAVVGATGALQIPDGAEVYVDGVRGRVVILETDLEADRGSEPNRS